MDDGKVSYCDQVYLFSVGTPPPGFAISGDWYHVYAFEVLGGGNYILKVDYYRHKLAIPHEAGKAPVTPYTLRVEIAVEDHNMWRESFTFENNDPGLNQGDPTGKNLLYVRPLQVCTWKIVEWIDQDPNDNLDPGDLLEMQLMDGPQAGARAWWLVERMLWDNKWFVTLSQAFVVDKYVYVDGNLISGTTATGPGPLAVGSQWNIPGEGIWTMIGWIKDVAPLATISVGDKIKLWNGLPPPLNRYAFYLVEAVAPGFTLTLDKVEILKPCHPDLEELNIPLDKCKHYIEVKKHFQSDVVLCPNNDLDVVPYYCHWMNISAPCSAYWITIAEDITGSYHINPQLLAPDCKVDLKDVYLAGKAFGGTPGHPKWNSVADINKDYKIDLKDYYAISKMFGKW